MNILLIVLGFIGSFITGISGIGGAIIMISLLLYLPGFFGFPQLKLQTITGMVVMQGLFSMTAGSLLYRKKNLIHKEMVIRMGVFCSIGSFLGAVWATFLTNKLLLIVFAALTFISTAVMFLPAEQDEQEVDNQKINKFLAWITGFTIGIFAGLLGLGGGFLIVPAMIYLFKISTKVTVGSSLAISLLISIGGFLGKLGFGELPLWLSLMIILGAVPGVLLGGMVGSKLKSKVLHRILIVIMGFINLRIWYDLGVFDTRYPELLNPIPLTWQTALLLTTVGSFLFLDLRVFRKAEKGQISTMVVHSPDGEAARFTGQEKALPDSKISLAGYKIFRRILWVFCLIQGTGLAFRIIAILTH